MPYRALNAIYFPHPSGRTDDEGNPEQVALAPGDVTDYLPDGPPHPVSGLAPRQWLVADGHAEEDPAAEVTVPLAEEAGRAAEGDERRRTRRARASEDQPASEPEASA